MADSRIPEKTEAIKEKRRPYWHVDAKWIAGIIFTLLLTPTVLAYGLSGITSEASSVGVFSAVVLELKLAKGPVAAHKLAGDIYSGGSEALIDRFPDKETGKTIETARSVVDFFTRGTNRWLRTVLIVLTILEIIPLALLIFFSRRFGRIKSVGYAVLLGSLPGLVLSALLQRLIIGSDFSLPASSSIPAAAAQGLVGTRLLLPLARQLATPFVFVAYLGLFLVILALTLELVLIIKNRLAKQSIVTNDTDP